MKQFRFGLGVIVVLASSLFLTGCWDITISVTGNGTTDPAPGRTEYPNPRVVTVTAIPDMGWRFDHWEGDIESTANPLVVDQDVPVKITAVFVEDPRSYTLNLSIAGNGTLNLAPGTYTYPVSTVVSLTATPDAGYRFDQWDGDVTGYANPISFTMDADKTVTATFVELLPESDSVVLGPNAVLELVHLPAGSFMMGSSPDEYESNPANEGRRHEVSFSHPFWVGKYEVTMGQWQAVMGTTPWVGQTNVVESPNNPAVWISWEEAQEFLVALNTLTGDNFRLLSEAEWEYACRAGTTTRFYWGDDHDSTIIGAYAWWNGNATAALEAYGHAVGIKHENPWGLFDMSGNVREWCQDWYLYGGYPTVSITDPTGPPDATYGEKRVVRGGYFNAAGAECRSAYREGLYYKESNAGTGFRVARTSYID